MTWFPNIWLYLLTIYFFYREKKTFDNPVLFDLIMFSVFLCTLTELPSLQRDHSCKQTQTDLSNEDLEEFLKGLFIFLTECNIWTKQQLFMNTIRVPPTDHWEHCGTSSTQHPIIIQDMLLFCWTSFIYGTEPSNWVQWSELHTSTVHHCPTEFRSPTLWHVLVCFWCSCSH